MIKKFKTDDDYEQILADAPALNAGAFGLWVRVFIVSVKEIQQGSNDEGARSFLFDESNDFLQWILDELGISHAALIERLKRPKD